VVDQDFESSEITPESQRSWSWRDAQTNTRWLFGMQWLPTLGAHGQRVLHRNLRLQGTVWAVNHGQVTRLIGVQAATDTEVVNRHSASAAVAFALTHPKGAHALCIEVVGQGVWLVACDDGCVLSQTDRWFDSLGQAQVVVQSLRERHVDLRHETLVWVAHSNVAHESSDEQAISQSQVPPFLMTPARAACRFRRVPSGRADWLRRVMLMALGLAAIGVMRWAWFSEPMQPPVDQLRSAQTQQTLAMQAHSPNGLQQLWSIWHGLPVDPAGWLLQSVRCRIADAQAHCKADYQRQKPKADNQGLKRYTPVGWVFEPGSLDLASYKRVMAMPVEPLQPGLALAREDGLSELQRLSADMAALTIGSSSQTTAIQAAATNDALEVATLPVATLRSLTLRLPLRESRRLEQLLVPVRWQQVDLSVVHGAQIDKHHGYLMLDLQGDWFETF